MKNISVFFDNSTYTWRWLQPLLWSRDELRKLGYNVNFVEMPQIATILKTNWHRKLYSSNYFDIVFLAFHHKSEFCQMQGDKRAEILNILKKKANKIVWLDGSDSTGTCMFDVLQYVDLYLKKQLLKDFNQYLIPLKGQRLFVDFYSRKYHLQPCEDETICGFIRDKSDLKKLDVSWNIAFWNNPRGGFFTKISKLLAIDKFSKKKIIIPNKERRFNVFFNGSVPDKDTALSYQRRNIIYQINALESDCFFAPTKLLPRKQYVEYMRNTLLAPSPFGWGEICSRDFEIFEFGCCLLKPCMDHLFTFPNLYESNKTYIPFKWDFSDFYEILDRTRTEVGRNKAVEIAEYGQQKYLYYRTNLRSELAKHIADVLKTHNI